MFLIKKSIQNIRTGADPKARKVCKTLKEKIICWYQQIMFAKYARTRANSMYFDFCEPWWIHLCRTKKIDRTGTNFLLLSNCSTVEALLRANTNADIINAFIFLLDTNINNNI